MYTGALTNALMYRPQQFRISPVMTVELYIDYLYTLSTVSGLCIDIVKRQRWGNTSAPPGTSSRNKSEITARICGPEERGQKTRSHKRTVKKLIA